MISGDAHWRIGYILTLTVITMFDELNDVTNLRHNAFTTTASSDKKAFGFHFFDAFHVLKSCNDALRKENHVSVF